MNPDFDSLVSGPPTSELSAVKHRKKGITWLKRTYSWLKLLVSIMRQESWRLRK
jgi:hypothetical protein